MSIFSNCSIYIGDVKNKQNLSKTIKDNGGTIAFMIGKTVTHMVTVDSDFQQQNSNVKKAASYNVEIVSEQWVTDSINKGYRENPAAYHFTLVDKISTFPVSSPIKSSSIASTITTSSTAEDDIPKVKSPTKKITAKAPNKRVNNAVATTPSIDSSVHQNPVKVELGSAGPIQYFATPMKPIAKTPITPSFTLSIRDPKYVLTSSNTGKLFKFESAEEPPFPQDFTISKQKTLQCSNISGANSNNKFYHLELQENEQNQIYRVFSRYGRTDGKTTTETRYYNSKAEAEKQFDNTIKEKTTSKGYEEVALLTSTMSSSSTPSEISTSKSTYNNEDDGKLDLSVKQLVESIFEEATKHLTTTLSVTITKRGIETPLGVLSLEQVEKGEQALDQIHQELKKTSPSHSTLETLSSKFYTVIPYKLGRGASVSSHVIANLHQLSDKVELLQLMKDLIKVNGDGVLSEYSATYMKYLALKNEIKELHPTDFDYRQVQNELKNLPEGCKIESVFSLGKTNENSLYTKSLSSKLLFHGSRYQNFVGLLSRGMLLPKVIVNTGGSRSDFGFLGAGIYYADQFKTSAQYAHPSLNDGQSRLMLISEVAVGKTKEFTKIDATLTQAPFGFNSCLGVAQTSTNNSDFQTNEYVIYNPNQQRQKYLVKFTLPGSSLPVKTTTPPPTITPSPFSFATTSKPAAVKTVPLTSNPSLSFGSIRNNNNNNNNSPSSQLQWGTHSSSKTSSLFSKNVSTKPSEPVDKLEEEFRQLFIKDRSNPKIKDPLVHCLNVFQDESFKRESLVPSDDLLLKHDRHNHYLKQSQKVVDNFSDFQREWMKFTGGLFTGFNWSNVFVAGGAVLGCTLNQPSTNAFQNSDIDIFLYGLTETQATDKLKEILTFIQNKSPNTTIARTKYAVTFLNEYPYRNVQVVLRIYKSPAEVLMGFDIDCCSIGFDGQRVSAIPRARDAIVNGINIVDMSRRSTTYETRLFKYAKRGFAVKVPGFDSTDIPSSIYSADFKSTVGLQRLLLLEYHYTAANYPPNFDPKSIGATGDSDYSEVDIPWGQLWRSRKVSDYLTYKDKSQFFANAKKSDAKHKHVVVVGEAHVFSGKAVWCKKCIAGQRAEADSVSGPLQWMTENPGSQQLLTGSFHPVTDDQWYNLDNTSNLQLNDIKNEIVANRSFSNNYPVYTPKIFKRQEKSEDIVFIIQTNHLISIASALGSDRSLESLLAQPKYKSFVNIACQNGYYPLHYACMGGSLKCVELLIKNGAIPRLRSNNRYKISCAMIAKNFRNQDICDYLVRSYPYLYRLKSSIVGRRNLFQWDRHDLGFVPPKSNATTIHNAIGEGSIERVQELLNQQVPLLDSIGQSALHMAIVSPNPQQMFNVISQRHPTLLMSSANRFGQNLQDYVLTALTSIQTYYHWNVLVTSDHRKQLKDILEKVKLPNTPYNFSYIPIYYRDGGSNPSLISPVKLPQTASIKSSAPIKPFGFGGKFQPQAQIIQPQPINAQLITSQPRPQPINAQPITFQPQPPTFNFSNSLHQTPVLPQYYTTQVQPTSQQLPLSKDIFSIQLPALGHPHTNDLHILNSVVFQNSSLVCKCLVVINQLDNLIALEASESKKARELVLSCYMPVINSIEAYLLHRNQKSLVADLKISLSLK
ncbi:hypothetical protein DLAC_09816 [Tieghemostelium lacteum]|uniref:Poly [ADP-ribose] polymerase n=1 Tax=Tieghemostelium lacteum TaxID=361077 RepID=A0A151Z7A2_TIELA|nr:hypothetical protein DLAC_09816 [Tieghemostelium lacteum]|eukprot:KYQ89839.1 hypothetical protein DLAC_09816 [Tieghemostelium lacteum]